jgi:hypothetical protein
MAFDTVPYYSGPDLYPSSRDTLSSYSVEAISCVADSMRILVNQRDMLGVVTAVRRSIYTKAGEIEKEKAHALH